MADAQAKQAEEIAKAQATDTVFENLPDTLIAPADGPTPILTGDFGPGYEAVDFYLGGTVVSDTSMGDVFAGWSLLGPATPHFMPERAIVESSNSQHMRFRWFSGHPTNNLARGGPAAPRDLSYAGRCHPVTKMRASFAPKRTTKGRPVEIRSRDMHFAIPTLMLGRLDARVNSKGPLD